MILIVGLGNDGRQYVNTRHNIGHKLIDHCVNKYANGSYTKRLNANTATTSINGIEVMFIKPISYMNIIGSVVAKFLKALNIGAKNLLVIHDDLEVEIGMIKYKSGGGNAGHNGLRSIEASIGTRDYARIRIGIGRPDDRYNIDKYVLDIFDYEQRMIIDKKLALLSDNISYFLDNHDQINNILLDINATLSDN